MEWMLMPLRRYADFSGRSQRMEFWMFSLFCALISSALLIFGFNFSSDDGGDLTGLNTLFLILLVGFALFTLIPSIAVTVRRFHDQDKSGWFYLLGFIPYVGGLILLVFMCIEGTPGPNRFGPDPKGGHADIFG